MELDELVLDMRDIMELAYIFLAEKEVKVSEEIYSLLRDYLNKFYRDCYASSKETLRDSLFYVNSLINAYDDEEVLKMMAQGLKSYVINIKNDNALVSNEGKTKK